MRSSFHFNFLPTSSKPTNRYILGRGVASVRVCSNKRISANHQNGECAAEITIQPYAGKLQFMTIQGCQLWERRNVKVVPMGKWAVKIRLLRRGMEISSLRMVDRF